MSGRKSCWERAAGAQQTGAKPLLLAQLLDAQPGTQRIRGARPAVLQLIARDAGGA